MCEGVYQLTKSIGVVCILENPCDAPEECVFPFEYNGITYLTCTTVGNAGEYWCAHDTNYNGDWSDCNCPSTLYEVTVTLEGKNICMASATWASLIVDECDDIALETTGL